MNTRNSSDGFWETLVVVIVVGALAVAGYRKFKPDVAAWLSDQGIDVGALTDSFASSPGALLVDFGAAVLGLTLLVALFRGLRKALSNRKGDDKKQKRRIWR